MKNDISAVILLLILLAPYPSFSAEEKSIYECRKYLIEMKEHLDTLESFVPNVPPDEAVYLDKEDSAAIKAESNKRIFDVEHRPYFTAWELHNSFDIARTEIELNEEGLVPKQDPKFAIQMASRIPYHVTEVRIVWNNFDNADKGKILTNSQVVEGIRHSIKISGLPGDYIYCLASFIPEVK